MPRKQSAPPARRLYGSGTVTKLVDGQWRAQLPRGVDPNRRSTRHRTRTEAEAWLADQLDRFARGAGLDSGAVSLGEYADAWLDRQTRDTGTERAYRIRRRHLDVIAGAALEDLRPSHVERVLSEMHKTHSRRGEPLSARYQRLVVGLLSSVLMAAVRDGILTTNVVERVRLPALPQTETLVFSDVEARQLLRASVGTRWHAVWWIMLAVGLRSGEVRGLTWDDFDANAGSLRIRRSVRTPRVIGATKGRRERWVPLPAACVAAIHAHRELLMADAGVAARGRRKGSPAVKASPWMFPSHVTGRPYPSNTLWSNLRWTIDRAGLERLRPHDLRHGAATIMIARGMPLPVVAEILGHRSAAFTLSRYAHVVGGQHRQVADTMGEALTERAETDVSAQ